MDNLQRQYTTLLRHISTKHVRNLYGEISWNARLVGIKGARGVGKTTLLLQRIKLAFPDPAKALYVSLDDIWFGGHNLLDLAEMASGKGITHLFLDEVHRLPGWERQIKNIYDFFPGLSVVFTGSSLLEIDHSVADLSRRCLLYSMPCLSFREFLAFEGIERPVLTLDQILYEHETLAPAMAADADMPRLFRKYMRHGFYPFYKTETEADYLARVANIITSVIDYDIPSVEKVEYPTLMRAKHLLSVMAAQPPSPLNMSALCSDIGTTKNQAIRLLDLLSRADVLRLLYYHSERNPKSLAKPQKVLLSNPSIAAALGHPDPGKSRESFLACMMARHHEVGYPREGDLLVDRRYIFEIGGAGKGFAQIRNMPDSFVAADGIQFGFGNKIPLWLFGLLY